MGAPLAFAFKPRHPSETSAARRVVLGILIASGIASVLAPTSARAQGRWWERPPTSNTPNTPTTDAPTVTETPAAESSRELARPPAPGRAPTTESVVPQQRVPQHGQAVPNDSEPEDGSAAAGEAATGEDGLAPEVGVMTGPPEWRWQQVLSNTRIGARLTALAVDPRNPNRIYVGTEAYTLLVSQDGGITWIETELDPINRVTRQLQIRTPGLPNLGDVVPNGFNIFLDPPYREAPADRIEVPGNIGFDTFFNFSTRSSTGGIRRVDTVDDSPVRQRYGALYGQIDFGAADGAGAIGYVKPIVTVGSGYAPETLLDDATRVQPSIPVYRVAVCPGGVYPVMVATQTELLGSQDGGLTFVRMLRLPGRVIMNHVACGEEDPNLVLAATSFGPFLSFDGGITWDQDLSGWPGRDATGAAFDPRPGNVGHTYVAVGSDLFMGDPQSEEGLQWVYPDFNNSATAPWERINWVEPTAAGEVWLATDDGLRYSNDGGVNWFTAERGLLDRQKIEQVRVGTNEAGGPRVAVIVRECLVPRRECRRNLVYASDDNGDTWFPFFEGMTRRSIFQMVGAPPAEGIPPRWWIVTGGELWVTVPPAPAEIGVNERVQQWARRRLASTPALAETTDALLENLELTEEDVNWMVQTTRTRWIAPQIHFRVAVTQQRDVATFARIGARPEDHFTLDTTLDRLEVSGFVFAQWSLNNLLFGLGFLGVIDVGLPGQRDQLYTLRRQISFLVEDAWRERQIHLRRLAGGMNDPLLIEVLKARIEGLEALMEIWLDQDLVEPLRRR